MTKRKTNNSLVVNIRSVVKDSTDMNVSAEVLREIRELTEDFFVPFIIRTSEKKAKSENKKTIQERDYLAAKDVLMASFKSYGLI